LRWSPGRERAGMKNLSLTVFAVVCIFSCLRSAAQQSAVGPGLVFSTAAPNSGNRTAQGPWPGVTNPDYRVPLPELAPAGATIILFFGYDGTQGFTVSDDKANTYVLDVTSPTSNGRTTLMYHASNVAAGTSYVNVHMASGTLAGYWQPLVAVFYNVGAVDGTPSCNAATSATISAGNITPTVSGDLVFQAVYAASYTFGTATQTAPFTAGSQTNINWNLASQLLGDGAASQYGIYNSTAALNPTFTQAASDSYISCAVAFKAAAAGSNLTTVPRVLHQEHDAMWKSMPNPWHIGMVVTAPGAVYISAMENDPISNLTSSPAPDVGWTKSGPDHQGLNGHNSTYVYCAQFRSPPGPIDISVTRTGTINDAIYMLYDVVGGTCTLDVDSGGQDGQQTTLVTSLTTCNGCITPTKQNDIIFANEGQGFCTATGVNSPTGDVIFDSAWFSGNTIDGPTQTDENNFWMHYRNGSSLSPVTVTIAETCQAAEQYWAGRVAAYQSVSTGAPQPPTGLSAIVH